MYKWPTRPKEDRCLHRLFVSLGESARGANHKSRANPAAESRFAAARVRRRTQTTHRRASLNHRVVAVVAYRMARRAGIYVHILLFVSSVELGGMGLVVSVVCVACVVGP